MSVLDTYPRKVPSFTVIGAAKANFWREDGPGSLRRLYRELCRAAMKYPGTVPWRILRKGAEVGVEFFPDEFSIVVTIQRCGLTAKDAVAKFGTEVSTFIREFEIGPQVMCQRILDERHLPERSLRWICQVGPKTVDPAHVG